MHWIKTFLTPVILEDNIKAYAFRPSGSATSQLIHFMYMPYKVTRYLEKISQ